MAPATGNLYFHSPCFDGIASAVLAWDFLTSQRGWATVHLHPVTYDVRSGWLERGRLADNAAVVDFLYHPAARLWADHHLTTFVTDEARQDFERRTDSDVIYDPQAGSCAMLLWRELERRSGYRQAEYAELVEWADRIDAARYASVDEAITATAPALRISLGLVLGEDDDYVNRLVVALRRNALTEVADFPEVMERYRHVRDLTDLGLDRFKRDAHIEDDGIVVFDVDADNAVVSRYAPYYFFPDARYSVGIVRHAGGAKLTAMRNPWREFSSVPLGRIAESLGGGGHHRVAAIALRGERIVDAPALRSRFIAAIRQASDPAPAP